MDILLSYFDFPFIIDISVGAMGGRKLERGGKEKIGEKSFRSIDSGLREGDERVAYDKLK